MSVDSITAVGDSTELNPPPGEMWVGPYQQMGFAAMGGAPDEVVVASQNGSDLVLSGYDLDGTLIFRDQIAVPEEIGYATLNLSLATLAGGGVAAVWQEVLWPGGEPHAANVTAVFAADGARSTPVRLDSLLDLTASIAATPTGYHVQWTAGSDTVAILDGFVTAQQQDFTSGGAPAGAVTAEPGRALTPFADILIGGVDFTVRYNQAQLSGQTAITLPGEPAHAVTEATAAALADGHSAAVAWADSGTDYVLIYDSAINNIRAVAGLDWGGASDLHLVALDDGGFAVSWENGGQYKGELFDSTGAGGGVVSLAGLFGGLDSHGDLYTVGLNSAGAEAVQIYALNAPPATNPAEVTTGAVDYTAPAGVTHITLTGAQQHIDASATAGVTIDSSNGGATLLGGAGNDVFHLGRGGDVVTGGAGADTFAYGETPWAGGVITDFNAAEGDRIDVSGLLSRSGYSGSDPFADSYLKFTAAGDGSAQLWSDIHLPGADAWWLVATIDGVSTSSLHYSGGLIT